MIFLTEEDVRQRCELGQGGEFCLQAGERLTPAATELLRSRNCRVILPGQCTVEAQNLQCLRRSGVTAGIHRHMDSGIVAELG